MARLLKAGGRYIVLAFPIDSRSGGPPYVVQPDAIVALYAGHGFTLLDREKPLDSAAGRAGYEELLILRRS